PHRRAFFAGSPPRACGDTMSGSGGFRPGENDAGVPISRPPATTRQRVDGVSAGAAEPAGKHPRTAAANVPPTRGTSPDFTDGAPVGGPVGSRPTTERGLSQMEQKRTTLTDDEILTTSPGDTRQRFSVMDSDQDDSDSSDSDSDTDGTDSDSDGTDS